MIPSRADIKRRTGKPSLDDLKDADGFLSSLEAVHCGRRPRSSRLNKLQPRQHSLAEHIPTGPMKLRWIRNSIKRTFQDIKPDPVMTPPTFHRKEGSEGSQMDYLVSSVLKYCRRFRITPIDINLSSPTLGFVDVHILDSNHCKYELPIRLKSFGEETLCNLSGKELLKVVSDCLGLVKTSE
ncbi:hypothetical protein P9112_012713 [Eukaryota sp. TZLM1-RC]